jgi:hypothetical protein
MKRGEHGRPPRSAEARKQDALARLASDVDAWEALMRGGRWLV